MIRAITHSAATLLIAALLSIGGGPTASTAPEDRPVLQLSETTKLTEGQRITARGSGFRPGLAAVAVGVCRQGFTNGLKDCDLDGGATFVNIGDDGTFGTLTFTLRHRFQGIDCLREQCVVAAAPLPGTEPPAIIAANSAEVLLDFAGAQLPVATTAAVAAGPATDTDGPSTLLWMATAGLLVIVAGLALADRRRL
ncbi:GPS-CTERM domain-containing protein [Nocardia iowensis]|uniref:LPXTG cell wall anchor domain-containing protein n=1 Tax=Nocardia iowensis TaxID=204891 RepID=A0ABX8RUS8_NOCIO|nr:GPS-CTERM domain-containing protein [Nocardia iowensis]QXN93006.1 hypothetical protein KV110_07820 [Nocardia iowensis]